MKIESNEAAFILQKLLKLYMLLILQSFYHRDQVQTFGFSNSVPMT